MERVYSFTLWQSIFKRHVANTALGKAEREQVKPPYWELEEDRNELDARAEAALHPRTRDSYVVYIFQKNIPPTVLRRRFLSARGLQMAHSNDY